MTTSKLVLIILAAWLFWQLLTAPAQSAPSTPTAATCTNPGAQVWAEMNVLERAAYGLCAAKEVTK